MLLAHEYFMHVQCAMIYSLGARSLLQQLGLSHKLVN